MQPIEEKESYSCFPHSLKSRSLNLLNKQSNSDLWFLVRTVPVTTQLFLIETLIM